MKLRKGDKVRIITGKDKGKTGKIEKIMPGISKVFVPGINEFKRHLKSKLSGQKSEIITITKPLPVSVVALVCPKCEKPTRVGYKIEKNIKVRICRKCKKEI